MARCVADPGPDTPAPTAEEAAAAVGSLYLAQGEPSVAAAVLRRRLAATNPYRVDIAAMIELLGEARIALLRRARPSPACGGVRSLRAPAQTANGSVRPGNITLM